MKIKYKILLILFVPCLWVICTGGGKRTPEAPLIARRVDPEKYKKSSDDLIVTFIDVGQGNCILVEAPSGTTLLYDAGGVPEWMQTSWNPGMDMVVPYIEKRGVKKIDYALMSHAHGDHIEGYKAVLYNFEIGKFMDSGFVFSSSIYKSLLHTVKSKKINYLILKEGGGKNINLGKDIICSVFNPPENYFHQGTNSDCNNNSIVLKIKYKNVCFLFPGDLEQEGELYCVKKFGKDLEANILQAGHHGSKTSSSKPFLEKVMPEIAVVPVGKKNTFGHPSPDSLSNLESMGAEVYRTDYDGNVIVYTNGESFIVETMENSGWAGYNDEKH